MSKNKPSIFQQLRVRPAINCAGVYTDLGGSVLSPQIWDLLGELNQYYVRMTDLLDEAGRLVAILVGAEAARITPGASAAIALAVGATMTGTNGSRWEQLPDTSGLRNEFVISAYHLAHYKYAVCARMTGGRFVAAGPSDRFCLASIRDAISERTSCVFVPVHLLDGFHGVEMLKQVVDVAHAARVPLVVDAAYMVYPTNLIKQYHEAGADLVCVSAKYFSGPNSGGFVAGRKKLISAVEGLDFTRFESGNYRGFGRAFKMSRYDVAATALALKDWFKTDHKARWKAYADKANFIYQALPRASGMSASLRLFTMSEEILQADEINCVVLEFSKDADANADDIARRLESDSPIIVAIPLEGRLIIAVDALLDGQEAIVAARLANALIQSSPHINERQSA